LDGNQHTDGRFLALDDTAQIADIVRVETASFDREDYLLRGLWLIVKVQTSVDSLVRPFLPLDWARIGETECPPSELVRVLLS
jgi:hypothetical protein